MACIETETNRTPGVPGRSRQMGIEWRDGATVAWSPARSQWRVGETEYADRAAAETAARAEGASLWRRWPGSSTWTTEPTTYDAQEAEDGTIRVRIDAGLQIPTSRVGGSAAAVCAVDLRLCGGSLVQVLAVHYADGSRCDTACQVLEVRQ